MPGASSPSWRAVGPGADRQEEDRFQVLQPKEDSASDILLSHVVFFLKNDVKQIENMRPYAPLGTLF